MFDAVKEIIVVLSAPRANSISEPMLASIPLAKPLMVGVSVRFFVPVFSRLMERFDEPETGKVTRLSLGPVIIRPPSSAIVKSTSNDALNPDE